MRTASVVVASGSDTRRWAPLDRQLHRVLADYPACRPCGFRECPYGHECALNISVGSVIEAAREQLALDPATVRMVEPCPTPVYAAGASAADARREAPHVR
jgi:hypothetical protein